MRQNANHWSEDYYLFVVEKIEIKTFYNFS